MHFLEQIHRTIDSSGRGGRLRVALIAGTCAVVLFAALFLFGGDLIAWWARWVAAGQLRAGAVSAAQEWLAWSARFRPKDGRADLIRAACFRFLRQPDAVAGALRAAQEHGAPADLIEREAKLAEIQSGMLPEHPEIELALMIDAGVPFRDACTVFVYGYICCQQPEPAKKVLDTWAGQFPEDPAVGYLRALYWSSLGERTLARHEVEALLDRQPRHELARMVLAELLEGDGDTEASLAQWFRVARAHPSNRLACLNLARLFRETGRISQAQTLAASLALRDEPAPDVLWELGEIALELGDYQQARRRFQQSYLNTEEEIAPLLNAATTLTLRGDASSAETLLARITSAATAISLGGDAHEADGLFVQQNAFYGWLRRVLHLRAILALNPNDHATASHLRTLSSEPIAALARAEAQRMAAQTDDSLSAESGPGLYRVHCAACHGADGDGNGRAARHLYPRPKNLRSGGYRLISTVNRIPTLQDLVTTVERGMPGASMPPFDNLSPAQRELLANQVVRLYRQGIRHKVTNWLSEQGEEIDQDEIDRAVAELTTPGQVVATPAIGPPGPGAIARGRELYGRLGCFHCHGHDGKGPADTPLTNDEGLPVGSPDLTDEPLKGGDQPQSLYLRLLLGMPGTPHPASPGLSEDELIDLVHFCRSLRREPLRNLTNHERMIRATRSQFVGVPNAP